MTYLSLFISAFLSATVLPGSTEVYLGILVATENYPVVTLLLVATVGNSLGAFVNYALGYFARNKFSKGTQADRVKRSLGKYGEPLLIFSWLPLFGDLLIVAAGYLKLNFFKAVPWIIVGKALRYLLVAWVAMAI